MYCVKCGVKLQDGVKQCPLCQTPVWDPNHEMGENKVDSTFSTVLPKHYNSSSIPQAAMITTFLLLGIFAIFVICQSLYHSLAWGGYAIGGILLFYVIFILPMWFRGPNPVVFVPCDFAAITLYLLFICLYTGGHWFLSFAFPITFVFAALFTTVAALLRYIQKGRMFLISSVLFSISLICLLIEFLAHVTFGFPNFRWSLYAAFPTFLFGIFFLVAALVKPLKNAMKRWFFI